MFGMISLWKEVTVLGLIPFPLVCCFVIAQSLERILVKSGSKFNFDQKKSSKLTT